MHTVLPTIIVEVLDFFFSLSFNSYFRAQDLLKSKCVWCFKMLPFTKANDDDNLLLSHKLQLRGNQHVKDESAQ